MIKFAQLKKRFDVRRMQDEVYKLEDGLWKRHYNTSKYEGGWTTLQLRSINGSTENNISIQGSALHKNMAYKDTPLLEQYPYLQSVISFFECEKMAVRLMKLDAGAVIKEHTDHEMNFESGETRFHIPIQTNPGVTFFIEEQIIPMNEGECWYLNLSLKHRVNNFGNASRIHLVIDCKVNEWVKTLLNENAELREEIKENREDISYNDSDRTKIIQHLRLMGTSTSIELADKMESGKN
ncbi:MAG: aspartyl/asparaginyl beta-hydroxylase domain-containing protein [Ginsengibacter sp.]